MRYLTGKPNLIDIKKLTRRLEDVLESGILTNSGPRVQELEEKFTELFGKPCVAYANATQGLEALVKIIGPMKIKNVQSFSFIATASCLKDRLINFLDIDDYYQCDRANGSLTANLFGSCSSNQDGFFQICDNAHAIGVKYKDKPLAFYSSASVYSLHSTKFLNSIEGGIVACHQDYVEILKQYRNFGYKTSSTSIFTGEIDTFGTNAKMSELHATVGLHNLNFLEFLINLNKERYYWYKKYLPEQCKLIEYPEHVEPNYSYIIIRVPALIRDKLCSYLYKEGVYVKQYFQPIHKLAIFNSSQHLPNTERIASEVIALPQGIQLKGERDVYFICNLITKFFKQL